MDKKLIAKLQNAGVAADVILSLIMDDEQETMAEQEQVEEKVVEPAANETAENTKEPDPVLAKLDNLIGAIQASNIIRAGRDSDPTESVDDILAKMIMPNKK